MALVHRGYRLTRDHLDRGFGHSATGAARGCSFRHQIGRNDIRSGRRVHRLGACLTIASDLGAINGAAVTDAGYGLKEEWH